MTSSTLKANAGTTPAIPPDPEIPNHPQAIQLLGLCLREVRNYGWKDLRTQCDQAFSDPRLDDDIRALLRHTVDGRPSDETRRTGIAHWLLRQRLAEWERKQAARRRQTEIVERLLAERNGSPNEAAVAAVNGNGGSNGSSARPRLSPDELFLQLQGAPDVPSWAVKLRLQRKELIASLEPLGLTLDTLSSEFLDSWGVLLRRRIPSNSFSAVRPHDRANSALRQEVQRCKQALRPQSVRKSAPTSRPSGKSKATDAVPVTGEAIAAGIVRAMADMDPPLGRTRKDLLEPILAILRRPECWEGLSIYLPRLTRERLLNASRAELKELKSILRARFG